MSLTISALLPAIVTLLIGYLAGSHKDFKVEDAGTLNRLVMLYALPMSLFAGTLATPQAILKQDLSLVLWVMIPIVVCFFIVAIVMRLLLKKSLSESTIVALLVSGPSIAFIGPSVFPVLFGQQVTPILISGGAMALNLVLTPVAVIALTTDQQQANPATKGQKLDVGKVFINAAKEPIIWAPILAYILSYLGVKTDDTFTRSFMLLGSVTSGIALFATGLILYSYKLSISFPVIAMALGKNLIMPAAVMGAVWILGLRGVELKETVVSMAIPAAAIATIFAVQYKVMQQTAASTMFLSYILAPFTLALFIMWS